MKHKKSSIAFYNYVFAKQVAAEFQKEGCKVYVDQDGETHEQPLYFLFFKPSPEEIMDEALT